MLTYLSRDLKFCFLSSLFAIDLKSQVWSYSVFLFLFFFFYLKKWNSLTLLMVTVRNFKVCIFLNGLPWCGGLSSKESSCNAGDQGWIPGSGNPLENGIATHPVFLSGEFQGHRSLVGSLNSFPSPLPTI